MTEPLTEQRQVSGPVVYGYLRLTGRIHERRAALQGALLGYCHQHEMSLGGVFVDRGDGVAFTALLDVLMMANTFGLVLPARNHLGPRSLVASRERRIRDQGARLMLIRDSVVFARPSRSNGKAICDSAVISGCPELVDVDRNPLVEDS